MMQLAHVQRHFVAGGIGLRQVCDYYCLLTHATADDRRTVAEALRTMGLRRTAGALMWVLAHVLHMDEALMLCPPDSYRGEWMLREIMDGGNFGHYNSSRRQHWTKRVIASRVRNLRQMRFCAGEALWVELNFWRAVIETLPTRIRYRTFSLAEVAKRNEHKQ